MVRTIVLSMILAGLALAGPHVQAGKTEEAVTYERGEAAFDDGDYDTAYREWLSLAEAGNANGQFGLGKIFSVGGGSHPRDLGVGAQWYAMAAKQGHVTALDWLGEMYARGEGVPKDLKRAECLYLHAARRGKIRSYWSLRDLYRGLGHNEEADAWLARILAASSPYDLYWTGWFILDHSEIRDPGENYAFLFLAEERGSNEATALLKAERSTLNPLVHIRLVDGRLIANKWRALKATPMVPPSPVEDACLPG